MAALGLLMLGAALLAGTSVASLGMRRAVRGRVAVARAEWEARHAVGVVVQGWSGALDSMAVGAVRDLSVSTPPDGPPTLVVARVRRLSADRYAATVSVRAGASDGAATLAVRRMRLLLERRSQPAGGTPGDSVRVVMPIARWRVVEAW